MVVAAAVLSGLHADVSEVQNFTWLQRNLGRGWACVLSRRLRLCIDKQNGGALCFLSEAANKAILPFSATPGQQDGAYSGIQQSRTHSRQRHSAKRETS